VAQAVSGGAHVFLALENIYFGCDSVLCHRDIGDIANF
jgi:hypothetical protein